MASGLADYTDYEKRVYAQFGVWDKEPEGEDSYDYVWAIATERESSKHVDDMAFFVERDGYAYQILLGYSPSDRKDKYRNSDGKYAVVFRKPPPTE